MRLPLQISLLSLLIWPSLLFAQSLDEQIRQLDTAWQQLEQRQKVLKDSLEVLKLARIRTKLHARGLPQLQRGEKLIEHAAFMLVYDEAHEQAAWVAHMLVPEVREGNVSRTNDFRVDPLVATGTAVEKDYFLKFPQDDGSIKYDGFGYDRGHLAPSADFRWSATALSESYFYSNMSPQVPELNRESWAELESWLRSYMYRFPTTSLYIVSGPVLHDSLPKISRSVNGVSIPEKFFKVVLDFQQQRAIGFLMPNRSIDQPVESWAVSIDEIEGLTGLDFFHQLPDELEDALESQSLIDAWLPADQQDDVRPLKVEALPPGYFNTLTAKTLASFKEPSEVNICGTVVSTKLTSKGHIFLNLDKKFPNQIFTVAIWKDSRKHFSYEPQVALAGKCLCATGKVRLSRGTPTMEIKGEEAIRMWPFEE
ncbi:MAG: DNA/RNA non-specific endonuclease [Bacteroidota bacterium]